MQDNDNSTTPQNPTGAPQSAPVDDSQKPVDPNQLIGDIKGEQQTSASDFKKSADERKNGELIKLSSGHTLRISRPSVNNLVKSGQLPSELANAAIKMQSGGQINDTDMKRYVEYNERIVKLSVVSPKIVDNPNYENDEISLDDLDDTERSEILLFVNGGLDALAKFRSNG